MKYKIIFLVLVVIIASILIFALKNNKKENIDIKNDKEKIYELFNNFPESQNIYYSCKSLYSERSIGPTIFQLDILAELTDGAYESFINQVEFEDLDNIEVVVNPLNKEYNWKKVKNIDIIASRDIETASINSIYLDEDEKTIYIVAVGGN